MTLSADEIREELISSFPPGVEEFVDWSDAPGDLVQGFAETLKVAAVDAAEQLRLDINPLTCGSGKLADWEVELDLSATKTSRYGSIERRRAQVMARLREKGPPTRELVRSVIAPLLDYPDPSLLYISEPDRAVLRTAHTYPPGFLNSLSFSPGTPALFQFRVSDDGPLSPAGAQLDLTITHSDLSKVSITLTSPTSSNRTLAAGTVGRGSRTSSGLRACFASLTASSVLGLWTAQVSSASGSGTIHDAGLFVEGWKRDSTGRPGLSAAKFEWGVVYESRYSNGNPDFDAAQAAVLRLNYATRIGALLFREVSNALPDGDFSLIPNDDNAIPDEAIPG